MKVIAKWGPNGPIDGLLRHHRREQGGFDRQADAYYQAPDEVLKSTVCVRWYFSRSAETCYCCIWLFGHEIYATGSAAVRGSGYDKRSAAAAAAFHAAGILFEKDGQAWDFAGVGHSATEAAVLATADLVNPDAPKFFYRTGHA